MALGTRPITHVERSYGFLWNINTLAWVPYDTSMAGGGGSGGAVTIANGADVAEGSTTDAAVTTNSAGSVSAKLRGLVAILSSVWDSVNGRLNVAITAPLPAGSNAIGNVVASDGGGSLTVDGAGALTAKSGSVSSSGNNTLVTPTSGKKLRVYYLSYNPASPATLAFRFGAAGSLFLQNNVVQGGSIIAKDFGDLRYVEGAIDEALILNLSSAITAIWNANYIEV